jgi:PAS domain S-box-containing protein
LKHQQAHLQRHKIMETVIDQIPATADAKFQYLLESAPDAIVIVDDAGRIAIVNHQAEALFGYDRAELLGQSVELLLPEQLRAIHVHHRANYTIEPHTRPMKSGYTLKARRKDGSEFPTEVSLSPLQTENGLLITSVIRDITERVQAETALRRQTRFVELLQEVAVTANQASSVEVALQSTLDQVCAHTGWPIGHVYLPSPDDRLEPSRLWHLDDAEQFKLFRKHTDMLSFATGAGLIGRVLMSKKPAWSVNPGADPQFMRGTMALANGIKAGFAFPVLVGAEVVAVLEFFSTEAAEPDQALLDVLPAAPRT